MIEDEEFRKAIRAYTTGVTVVTIPLDDEKSGMHGMTATSFASVAVEPQLVSVSVAKVAKAHSLIMRARAFGINFMLESQHELANYFAGRLNVPRREIPFSWIGESPVLDECLGHFACRVWARHDAGSHTIVVGEVLEVKRTDHRPLVCSRGRFHLLGAQTSGHQPTGPQHAPELLGAS